MRITGSKRSVEASREAVEKHANAIIHYCEGGMVETQVRVERVWVHVARPHFWLDGSYRPLIRQPKAGEVWELDGDPVFITARLLTLNLNTGVLGHTTFKATFAYSTLDEYAETLE